MIGPEFTFGIYMSRAIKEPILIIKTARGGKSLHTDFRPPSAGPQPLHEYIKAKIKERKGDVEKAQQEEDKRCSRTLAAASWAPSTIAIARPRGYLVMTWKNFARRPGRHTRRQGKNLAN